MRLRALGVLTVLIGGGYLAMAQENPSPKVDPIVSASATNPDLRDFTVSNMENGAACVLTRGRPVSTRSREAKPGSDCESVWPGLAQVHNWTENGDGTVALTDDRGDAVLTLGLGDGVDFESLEPANAVVALNSLG